MPKKKVVWKREDTSLITDYSLLSKKINPAFGIIDNKGDSHYYFGINRTCLTTMCNEEGREKKIKEDNLVLIKDNRTYIICDKETLKNWNYKLDCDLLLNNSKWSLEHIDDWLQGEEKTPKIEPLEPKELFNKIREEFKFYLDLPEDEWYDYLTLWTIGTYFYSFFSAYPMVYLYGLKNTGKTKIMTIASHLAFNGSMFIGITPATLFRIVQANKPSLFLDEIEKLLDKKREGSVDIEAMLNSGYKKGSKVPRCEKQDGKQVVKEYDVYCPKMFAHVKGKVSRTLISRCIRIIMQRTKPNDERGERWPEEHKPIWQELRNELYIFALEYWSYVLFYYEGTKEIEKEIDIGNRDWELWKPILVIAKMVNDDLYTKMNFFAKDVTKEYQKDEKEGWEYIIVKTIKQNLSEERYYFISEIREWLKEEYEKEEDVPTSKSIGWELKRLGLTDRKKEGRKGTKWFLNNTIVNNLVLKLNVKEDKKEGKTEQTPLNEENIVINHVLGDVSTPTIEETEKNKYNINKRYNVTPTQKNVTTSQSTLENITKNMMTIITHLSKKEGLIPIGDVVRMAQNAHISEEKVEEAIEYLLRNGLIFEPKRGFIKILQ